jgi:hypothetical protein
LKENLVENGLVEKINIINISEEVLGKDLYSFILETKSFQQWKKLNIDSQKMNEICGKLFTFENIKKFCDELGELDWRIRLKGCEDILVEQDTTFQTDCFYVYAFILALVKLEKIPTPDEFWHYWRLANCEAMENNLNLYAEEPTTIIMWLKRKYTNLDYDKFDRHEEAQIAILNAAEYRCKKAYCAILRELYLISYFSHKVEWEFGIPVLQPFKVWWHPVIDIACKTDAIVINSKNKVIALAVYLNTNKSKDWGRNKADRMPTTFMDQMNAVLSAPIDLDRDSFDNNTIVLPTLQSMVTFRLMINGNSTFLRNRGVYYRENCIKEIEEV